MRAGARRNLSIIGILAAAGVNLSASPASSPDAAPVVEVIWRHAGQETSLAAWNQEDLKAFKQVRLVERDPATGEREKWRGTLLRDLLDGSMKGLTVENQARIDLVVIEGRGNERALIPRSFVRKYGVILDDRSFHSVVPWGTEREAVSKEILPIESYFVPDVRRIVLTGSDESYKPVLLQRRTDPLAIRGESLFVRACMGCHARSDWPDIQGVSNRIHRAWEADAGHPRVAGLPSFGEPEIRALRSYLKAAREENPNRVQTAQQSGVPSSTN